MTENTENTLSAYLGHEFQQRLMWQLLVEPEFAEKILPDLAIEYFDDPNLKRLFIIILEYFKEYEKVPNLQNQSIHQAINKYKTPNNQIEEESLFAVIKRIELWNERIINKQMLYDGDVVQKSTNAFIKQQEYRKLAENIQDKVKSGDIKSKYTIAAIEEKFQKISHIGDEDDDCELLTEGIKKALRKEFRQTIPTGIETIDVLTGGGLGKGEIGVILTPSGVGKTTALTIIANTAYEQEKNVAQIIFEDTKDQIKRKHFVIWADSALSKVDDEEENERVYDIADAKARAMEGKGRLVIKRFSQEDTTIKDVKNWMLGYEKKWGFKFDILVLDYLDCLESHKKSPDRNEAELAIIKGFESLSADMDIPAWTAIQSNRSGFGSEFVEAHQTGGSIKRIQKAHFFMSVAKTPVQQEANFANIRIIKARFAKDGQTFEDCVFNNDTMQIIIDDPRYRYTKTYKNLKHYDEADIDKLEKKAEGLAKMHVAVSQVTEGELINDGRTKAQKINDLLHENRKPEDNQDLRPNTQFHNESDGVNEETNTGTLLELDETVDIEQVENIVVSNTINNIVNDDLLDFSGDTTTEIVIENEAKLEDLPPKNETIGVSLNEMAENSINSPHIPLIMTEPIIKKELDLTQFKSPGVGIYGGTRDDDMKTYERIHGHKLSEKPSKESLPKQEFVPSAENDVGKFKEKNINDLLKQIQETDPDKPQGTHMTVHDILVKKRDYQNVKPKG